MIGMDTLHMTLNYIMPKSFNDNRQETRNGLTTSTKIKYVLLGLKLVINNIKEACSPHVLAELQETF